MKKSTKLVIPTLIFLISSIITVVWTIVSFIIYLVKDESFNWFVFWVFIGSVVLMYFFFIKMIIYNKLESQAESALKKDLGVSNTKSKFQLRLEQAKKDQENRKSTKINIDIK